MLVKRFLNFTKRPKRYRMVRDVQTIDNEVVRFRLQVKRLGRWSDYVFKTEHPVCWVKTKEEGIQIIKLIKGNYNGNNN